jgi:hypothetical protein
MFGRDLAVGCHAPTLLRLIASFSGSNIHKFRTGIAVPAQELHRKCGVFADQRGTTTTSVHIVLLRETRTVSPEGSIALQYST